MRKLGTAIGAIALAAAASACSAPGANSKSASIFGGKVDEKNIGVATRAQAALVAGDVETGIALAERAVENSPTDAGFRALLGNAYFAAGRYNSADQAYRDSLRLVPVQPKIALKRALVLIGQGRNEAAVMMLNGARDMLDPADRGLGLALAGHASEAVAVLDAAARTPGADARVRQNLALAHALAGDWQKARIVASQDVPGHLIDARLQDWMTLAKTDRPSTRVASILGVHDAVSDIGMPVRLALGDDQGNRYAQIQQPPIAAEEPVRAAAPVYAAVAPMPEPLPAPAPVVVPHYEAAAEVPVIAPVSRPGYEARDFDIQIANVDLAEVDEAAIEDEAPAPVVRPSKPSAMAPIAMASASATRAEAPRPAFSPESTRLTQSARSIRSEAVRTAKASRSVVQVGAFSKRDRLDAGWSLASSGYAALKGYAPMAARTEIDGQTFYRLAAHGFASDAEARDFCQSLKASGGECWVRRIEGDTPFRLASRD